MQGPRLYRFFNYEQVTYVPAPVDGWNPDANPWELPETQAAVLDNFLLRPGKIIGRGGFQRAADMSSYGPLNVCGMAVPGQVLLARKSLGAGSVDPWNAPVLGLATSVLASGNTQMLYANAYGVVTIVTAPTADSIIGPRWINFDGLLYGISYDSAGAAVGDAGGSYFMKPLSLYTLSASLQTNKAGPNKTTAVADTAYAGSTNGWNDPMYMANGSGTGPTFTAFGSGGIADYLVATGYGLSIPAGATVSGIEVRITRGTTNGYMKDAHVQLMKAGAVQSAADRASGSQYPVGAQTVIYGGSSDLWGNTWTPADINNAGFGVAYAPEYNGPGTTDAVTMSGADGSAIEVVVYYTITVTTGAPLPTVITAAPHGAFDLKGFQSRIWLLGGIDTPDAGTTHSATSLFFTNPIVAGGGASTADWKDPATGLTNIIKMDDNTADYGVALATVRNGLLILRRNSLWFLKGTSTANYTLAPISTDTGCLDARSVVETDHGVYFLSEKGLMLSDGTKVVNASGSVMYTLQEAIAAEQDAVFTSLGGFLSCAPTSQGQLLVSVGANVGGGHVQTIWSGMYDPSIPKAGAWIRMTSQLWQDDSVAGNEYPAQLIWTRSPRRLYVVGDKYLTSLEDATQGESFLIGSSLFDQVAVRNYVPIPMVWKTKLFPIAGTATNQRRWGQGKRYFLDYAFAVGGALNTGSWTVTPIKADDTSYGAANVLQSTPGNLVSGGSIFNSQVASPAIQRENIDFTSEVDDIGFDVTWGTSGGSSITGAAGIEEIYGIGFEWQKTRERR